MKRIVAFAGMLCVSLAVGTTGGAELGGQTEAASVPTFTKDVAPILFKNCVTCHRPGQIAPMSLLSYREARPWSRSIKDKVVTREMPPWLADPQYGKFRNDRRLSQDEIDTIVAWADAGAPQGNDEDMPPVPEFSNAWVYGPPDHIIEMPTEYEVPAEGEASVLRFYSKVPFEQDRFVVGLEMKPSNVAVLHHANVHFQRLDIPEGARFDRGKFIGTDGGEITPERLRGGASVFEVDQGQLISYVPGRGYESYWPGVGKRIPAGEWFVWSVHYSPTGRPERDRTDIGLYFAKEPVRHVVITSQISGGTYLVEGKELIAERQDARADIPVIPPYDENWQIKAIMPIQDDITIYGYQPHAHLRSKEWQYIVTYPDGREEVLLSVPNYSFEWQLHYELAEPKKIPAGSRLMAIGRYDNSIKNRYNPGPHKEVYWAEQSWDEMFQGKFEYSVDRYERKPVRSSEP